MRGHLQIVLVLGSVLAATSWAADDDREASSIAEFVAAKDRWNRLVGQPMRLEGRYTVLSSSDLRFKNCDMKFELAKSVRRPPANTKNVEVAGELVRKEGDLLFRVSDLKPRESDAEQLALRRSFVNTSRPEELYELAGWARDRGRFYDDNELKTAADRLCREGLTVAHDHLKPGDITGLRNLATKADEFQLDPGIRLQYLHEADRLEWDQARAAADAKNYRRVLGLIRGDLPGASAPLPEGRLGIRNDYEAAPLAVYRVADSETRKLLDRAFYLEVALADILLQADPDGRNGEEIAGRIERQLPELASIAEDYRHRELQYLTDRLARLSRGQMLELSAMYKDRGDAQQATTVIRNWLKSQEPLAHAAGSTDLMELADEYVNLLGDERAAGRLYQLAYEQNPQLSAAETWLSTHGYEFKGTQWSKPGEPGADAAEVQLDQAIQEGRVLVGMTGEQVLKTLGTKPSSLLRVISSGQITEVWIFADFGISVRLHRRSSANTSEVVAIGTAE